MTRSRAHSPLRGNSFKVALTAALGLAFTAFAPCFAGDFEQGCQFYKAKSYSSARASFEKAARQYPKNWLIRYYLANTLLSSGAVADARKEYDACLSLNPDAQTEKYCRDTLAKLGGSSVKAGSSVASAGTSTGAASSGSDSLVDVGDKSDKSDAKADAKGGAKPGTAGGAAKEATRTAEQIAADKVIDRAKEEVAKVKAETETRLKTQGGWRKVSPEGVATFEFNERETAEIKEECDKRCREIMDRAERSVAHVKR